MGGLCVYVDANEPACYRRAGGVNAERMNKMIDASSSLRPIRPGGAAVCLLGLLISSGCALPKQGPAPSVEDALQQRRAQVNAVQPPASAKEEPAIAVINGKPLPRRQVVDLLLRGHGSGILEQFVVLEAARRRAQQQGLTINQADVDAEYERALRLLIDPLAALTPDESDQEAAERVLDAVLAERNISREEFMLGMRRNAYLRHLAQAQLSFSEGELREEYARAYGARVQVRHVQLATLAEVSRARARLAAGEGFAEVARTHSANPASARAGGLLSPFSAGDEEVPAPLRTVAFQLDVGEVSEAIRVGRWYHLLKLERQLPAEQQELEMVRPELEQRLRARKLGPAMQQLYQDLLAQADVRILDPGLRAAFERKHPR